jgi:hypothetical protein
VVLIVRSHQPWSAAPSGLRSSPRLSWRSDRPKLRLALSLAPIVPGPGPQEARRVLRPPALKFVLYGVVMGLVSQCSRVSGCSLTDARAVHDRAALCAAHLDGAVHGSAHTSMSDDVDLRPCAPLK